MPLTLTARRKAASKTVTAHARRKVVALSRSAAMKLAWMVAAMQGAVLLTFTLLPAKAPPRLPMMELIWAASRKPDFYPLVLLLTAGPILTVLAWQVRGIHRTLLFIFWTAFITAIFTFHLERVRIMLRVLAWEYL